MRDIKPVKSGWYNAFRPWSLHGAVVPVLIGGAVAYYDGFFCWWIFILVIIGGCLLQSAANLLNTYGDFVKGTDTVANELRSPELVTGKLKSKSVFFSGIFCLILTAVIGLVFVMYVGWGILAFGLLGISGAGLYTIGLSYKYHGMGLVGVFVMMGILMPMGTYFVMSGELSWDVLLISLPNSFLITAVLSGNETRDYHEDQKANVGTLSGHLSYEGSLRLYVLLNVVAFPILALLILCGILPWTCLIVFVTLLDLFALIKNSKNASSDLKSSRLLVPLSFRLNWHFGLLLVIGYIIGQYVITGVIL